MSNLTKKALLGIFLSLSLTACGQRADGQPPSEAEISVDEAKNVAMEDAGVSDRDAIWFAYRRGGSEPMETYLFDFSDTAGHQFSYEIDASNGKILSSTRTNVQENDETDGEREESAEKPNGETETPATGSGITESRAVEIAFSHAGIAQSDVSGSRITLDYEDGRKIFEVEFYLADGKEYDYEIAAADGTIVSYDYDAEHVGATQSGQPIKTLDEAREIALSRVPGAAAQHCSIKLDREDGQQVYDGKIVYGEMKYEFEISAADGTVFEWDVESIYD